MISCRRTEHMDIKTMPALQGFAVGDTVAVKPRMGAGYNKPGGVAKVVSLRRVESSCGGVGNTMYTVRYLVGGGGEKDLPAELLSLHTDIMEPRSSSSSSSAADSSTEARRGAELQLELNQKLSEIDKEREAERWQLLQDRKQAVILRQEIKALAKALTYAAAATEEARKSEEQLKLQLRPRKVSCELAGNDGAVAAATHEATSSLALKSKALQQKIRQEEKARKHAECAAKAANNKAAADSGAIVANVHRLLDEAKRAADEEHQASRQEQEMKIRVSGRCSRTVKSQPAALWEQRRTLG